MKISPSVRNKMHTRRGFSFVEVLIGMVILQIALLSFFLINQSSSSQSMDAYYEFLANSLGSEVIEFTQGMGYSWAEKYIAKPDLFPLGTWHGVLEKPIFAASSYFRECDSFERMISMAKVSSAGNGVLVSVQVRVKSNNKVKSWLSRGNLAFSTIVMEKPAR